MLVVATAVLGSLTVLPALLSLLGDRVDLGRDPAAPHAPGAGSRPGNRRLAGRAGRVLRRPLVSALLAAAALGALAAPALRLNPQGESLDDFATGSIPVVDTSRTSARRSPAAPSRPGRHRRRRRDGRPGDRGHPAVPRRRGGDRAAARADLGAGQSDRTVAIVTVGLSGSGTDKASEDALRLLRGTVLPAVFDEVAGVRDVAVTGNTAESYDFNRALQRSMPLVFLFVLGLTFVLVLLSFRSVVIAATTIVLNLLSVAPRTGCWCWCSRTGTARTCSASPPSGGITDWLPLMLFVILFGLSMDYHVFVLSRIREGYDRGLRTRQAVADGIAGTAGAITSAAVVMVAVFGLFATMPLASMKQIGVGLAVAVLLDATVVRAILLPAVMALLGERNWYLPGG